MTDNVKNTICCFDFLLPYYILWVYPIGKSSYPHRIFKNFSKNEGFSQRLFSVRENFITWILGFPILFPADIKKRLLFTRVFF
tara:strand:- start:1433 stop:1681 length:249 start_codon:yes stop_codon:yes gene_type:complete